MATIYSNKNDLFSHNGLLSHQISKNKIFVASNIFTTQFQIKNVHVIDGSSIIYETLKENTMQIIHQVVLQRNENIKQIQLVQKIRKLCDFQFVEKVFIEDEDYNQERISIQTLAVILDQNDVNRIKIVLQGLILLQTNRNVNQQEIINTLDEFLYFMKSSKQINLNCSQQSQNQLVLQNQQTNKLVFYPLDFLSKQNQNHHFQQSHEILIRIYLISTIAKDIKEYLYLLNKNTDYLLEIYENKFIIAQIKQFIQLLKNVIQSKDKYTQKMLICYIQILKQKHLKNVQQNAISNFISNQKSTFQPPERDNSPSFFIQQRQKQSNSFSNSNDTKPKSLSKKLKFQKENNYTTGNYRHSQEKKSSSMISMSPNRKNRKYLKYTSTNLFPNSKQTFQRSSSASFLMKTTQSVYQNTGNFLYRKDISNKGENYHSQNNFFKKPQLQNIPIKAESQIKSYLQTMGFGNKNIHKASKIDQRKNFHTLHYQNNKFQDNQNQSYHISAKQIQSQDIKLFKNERKEQVQKILGLDLNGDQKKLRLKQSLSLLEKKRNSQNYSTESQIPHQVSKDSKTKNQIQIQPQPKKDHHIIPIKQQICFIQKTPLQNPRKSINFNISQQTCMDIIIKGTKKQNSLKLQRSTVMVMHFVNFERKQTKRQNSYLSQQYTDKSIQQSNVKNLEIKKQKQLSFKPSLASLKKQKVGQKSQRHQKIMPNNNIQENLSSCGQQKSQERKKQPQKQKVILQNVPLSKSKANLKSEKQILSSISQASEIQTLSKNSLGNSQTNKQTQISNSVTLSKQFLKQIFLFINSENKTFVDLLGSKLSYQITFYAFYINYFKLNVTKTTTKEAIQKMTSQIKDYESKIMDSQKLNSVQKMIPQFIPFVKKLINLKIQKFMQNYWRKQELSQKEKQYIQKLSQQIDLLTVEILKVTLKIITNKLRSLKSNEKQVIFMLRSLKVCSTISQLIYCISNKLLPMTITQLKKITQTASLTQLGYEKSLINNLSKSQRMIQTYSQKIKQYQNGHQFVIDLKTETKQVQSLLLEM